MFSREFVVKLRVTGLTQNNKLLRVAVFVASHSINPGRMVNVEIGRAETKLAPAVL